MKKVIAYDIDGMLTEEEGRQMFLTDSIDDSTRVGIISARGMDSIMEFVQEHQLDPDFIRSTRLKGRAMRQLKRGSCNCATRFKYKGSNVKDRLQAKSARWDYEQL